jgi:hypothetical protein
MLQALADDMDDDKMCTLNPCTAVNQDALVARKTGLEHKIAQLEERAAQPNEEHKSQDLELKELEELEERLAKRDEALEIRALLFVLETQPPSREAFESHVAAMET